MKLKIHLIREILKHGAACPGAIADPSLDPVLNDLGAAQLTHYIGKLTEVGLVQNVSPLFGAAGGMWIGYQLSESGLQCAGDEDQLQLALGKLESVPVPELSANLHELAGLCEQTGMSENYRADFVQTVHELAICYQHACYIAAISLCGKILEIGLKEILNRHQIDSSRVYGIAKLLEKVRTDLPNQYVDETLYNISKIISRSRNTAVHLAERIPVPSRNQTQAVILSTIDFIERTLVSKGSH